LYEKPELVGNAMTFTPVSATLGGLSIPVGMLGQFTGNNMAEAQVKLPTLPLGMKADGVTVTSGGVCQLIGVTGFLGFTFGWRTVVRRR
jgi:hypothetical protein